MPSEQKNALIAVVLSGLILFGWQFYFAPQSSPAPLESSTGAAPAPIPPAEANPAGPIEPQAGEAALALTQGDLNLGFTDTLAFTHMNPAQTRFPFKETVGAERPFQVEISAGGQGFRPARFVTLEQSATRWVGEEPASRVKAVVEFTGHEMVGVHLSSPQPFKYRLSFASEDKKLENGQTRTFAFYDDSLRHWTIGDEETSDSTVSWAGIDFNYHLFGVVFPKPTSVLTKGTTDRKLQVFQNSTVNELKFDLLYVKKEYGFLSSLGNNLKHAVDFGMWGIFAEWILKGLQYFYTLIPNYGIAIILITFLVRLLTFPLQYKSFVSMKKMQLVQPEMNRIKEKFKDDPMRMQKETMELFKRSGANPLGGCLPLILQLPVFFAFYKVLYAAVELVDAPFYGWIHDLSNKDPYYVLPLLMTGAMFLQQKMTPATVTDPVQKKVFMFMPLIFGFIMKDLPSGLSLYILVSTLLGIGQQLLVFRMIGDKPAVA